jgi:osmotically-inducible protein OsmY
MPVYLRLALLMLGLLALPLSGCAPAAVGTGATAATTAAQERGMGGALTDTEIRLQINNLWFQESERMHRLVGLQVQNRRVLLTGIVDEPEMRRTAAKLAWQVDNVREVINEIRVGEVGDVGSYANDTWISSKLKSKILFDTEVRSINYSIETVHGRIYLIGIARSQAELDRVLNHARNIADVKEVVSYVEITENGGEGTAEAEDA